MTRKAPIEWRNIRAPLSRVKPWEHNPKQISKDRAERLLRLWDDLGQFQTIAVGPDFELYDGHQRYNVLTAARGLDLDVDMRQSSRALTTKERKRLIVESHATATGSFDWDMLANEFDAKELEDFGLGKSVADSWSSDLANIKALISSTSERVARESANDLGDAEDLLSKWGARPGQVWALGDHCLLCGDATDRGAAETVLGNNGASLCFTSPPYSDIRAYTNESDLSPDHLSRFISSSSDLVEVFAVNLGLKRSDSEIVRYWDTYIDRAKESGLLLIAWNVWDRRGAGGSVGNMTADFPIQHEFIFVFGRSRVRTNRTIPNAAAGKFNSRSSVRESDGSTRKLKESIVHLYGNLGTVFSSDLGRGKNDHPAVFPVSLPAAYIEACTNLGGIVYDPFSGSGSTLIACERLGRKCRAIEISPQYVALTLERWSVETGKKPKLISK